MQDDKRLRWLIYMLFGAIQLFKMAFALIFLQLLPLFSAG